MKIYVKKHSLNTIYEKICNLNTDSFYTEYVNEIFGNQAYSLLKNVENLQDFLEDSITYCKLVVCLLQNQTQREELQTIPQDWEGVRPNRIDQLWRQQLTIEPLARDIDPMRTFVYQMRNGQRYNLQERDNPQNYTTKTNFMRAIHENHPGLDATTVAIYQSIGDDFFGV